MFRKSVPEKCHAIISVTLINTSLFTIHWPKIKEKKLKSFHFLTESSSCLEELAINGYCDAWIHFLTFNLDLSDSHVLRFSAQGIVQKNSGLFPNSQKPLTETGFTCMQHGWSHKNWGIAKFLGAREVLWLFHFLSRARDFAVRGIPKITFMFITSVASSCINIPREWTFLILYWNLQTELKVVDRVGRKAANSRCLL